MYKNKLLTENSQNDFLKDHRLENLHYSISKLNYKATVIRQCVIGVRIEYRSNKENRSPETNPFMINWFPQKVSRQYGGKSLSNNRRQTKKRGICIQQNVIQPKKGTNYTLCHGWNLTIFTQEVRHKCWYDSVYNKCLEKANI